MGNCFTSNASRPHYPPPSPSVDAKMPISGILKHHQDNQSLKQIRQLSFRTPYIPDRSKLVNSSINRVDTFEISNSKLMSRPWDFEERAMVTDVLLSQFIFSHLDPSQINTIIEKLHLFKVKPNSLIIQQGMPATSYFIVNQGELEILVNGKPKSRLGAGMGFGELALLHDSERSCSVISIDASELWVIDRGTFRFVLSSMMRQQYEKRIRFLREIRIMDALDQNQIDIASELIYNFPGVQGMQIDEKPNVIAKLEEGSGVRLLDGEEIEPVVQGDNVGISAFEKNICSLYQVRIDSENARGLVVNFERLESFLGPNYRKLLIYQQCVKALRQSHIFGGLMEEIEEICEQVKEKTLEKGEILRFERDKLYSLLWGSLENSPESIAPYCINDKDIVEEVQDLNQDLVAGEFCILGVINKSVIEQLLPNGYKEKVKLYKRVQTLKSISFLGELCDFELIELAKIMEKVRFEQGSAITHEGEYTESIFFIKSGQIQVKQSNHQGPCILNQQIIAYPEFSQDATSITEITAYKIEKQQLITLLSAPKYSRLQKIAISQEPFDIEYLICFNGGKQGQTWTSYYGFHNQNKQLYCVKTISRRNVECYDIGTRIQYERRMFEKLRHPFICNQFKAFKDEHRIYFVMEYISTTSLCNIRLNEEYLDSRTIQMYVACIVLLMEYLHNQGIIYRDINPSNFLLDENGYPILFNFHTARFCKDRQFTVIGTPFFMAPEMILGKGYTYSVDYWGLGVTLYNFIYQQVPFGNQEDNIYTVYRTIVESPLQIPDNNYPEALGLITRLLNKDPAYRMKGGMKKLKSDQFFSGVDWKGLITKSLPMPHLPYILNWDLEIEMARVTRDSFATVVTRHEVFEKIPAIKCIAAERGFDWDAEF